MFYYEKYEYNIKLNFVKAARQLNSQ